MQTNKQALKKMKNENEEVGMWIEAFYSLLNVILFFFNAKF